MHSGATPPGCAAASTLAVDATASSGTSTARKSTWATAVRTRAAAPPSPGAASSVNVPTATSEPRPAVAPFKIHSSAAAARCRSRPTTATGCSPASRTASRPSIRPSLPGPTSAKVFGRCVVTTSTVSRYALPRTKVVPVKRLRTSSQTCYALAGLRKRKFARGPPQETRAIVSNTRARRTPARRPICVNGTNLFQLARRRCQISQCLLPGRFAEECTRASMGLSAFGRQASQECREIAGVFNCGGAGISPQSARPLPVPHINSYRVPSVPRCYRGALLRGWGRPRGRWLREYPRECCGSLPRPS